MTYQETWFVSYANYLPDTEIRLGQIITNPRKPAEYLGAGPLDVREFPISTVDREEENVIFEKEIRGRKGLGFSITLLTLLPFEISGDMQGETSHKWEIKKVAERSFHPSRLYVQQSIYQSDVMEYLKDHKYKKSVYMIVGVRIGQEARVTHSKRSDIGGKASVTVPVAASGVPIDLGFRAHGDKKKDVVESKAIPGSFVFAYRLREIRYSKKTKVANDRDFAKSADLHGLNDRRVIQRTAVTEERNFLGTIDEIEVEGLAGLDFEEDQEDTRIIDGCVIVQT